VAVVPHGYASADHPAIRAIGVGHDDSEEAEAALSGAVQAARRLGASLRVIRVFDSSVVSPAYMDGPGYIRAQENLERMARESLAETLERVPEDVHPEGVFRSGAAAAVLAAQSHELDLLVLGSRGYGPLRAVLLGGVSHKVLREARCPVLVLPRGEHVGLGALFVEANEVQAS
jgi:nucleotide-binding universal stress UspA family protein